MTTPLPRDNQERRRRIGRGGRRRTAAVLLVGTLVAAALLSPLALQIAQGTAVARRGIEERQATRTALARQFVDTYVAEVLVRVETTAELVLAGHDPTAADIALATRQMQMDAAVLLDGDGRLLQVFPARDELLGQPFTDRYAHLSTAVRERRTAVSEVVPAAATGLPIVAFAVPFETPQGTRVFSGGFAIERTPLGAFLRSFSPLSGSTVYLVDQSGRIADTTAASHRATLAEQDPGLAAAVTGGRASGTYDGVDGPRFFATEQTTAAPWRLVFSVPTATLYASVAEGSVMPWLLFAAFAAASTTSVVLLARVMHQRRRLVELAERDALTGLYNRRHVDAELERLARRNGRDEPSLAVLLIDIDHFKRINDEHGHHRGDDVLVTVADALRDGVRAGDIVCRWGGEEFMVLAPDADLDEAAALGERLRRAVSDAVAIDGLPVTASVGVAVMHDGDTEAAAARADRALYNAKAAGRDRVVTEQAASGAAADRPVSQSA